MAEKIAFRGKTQSELANLSMEDYLKMMTSRKRRSIKRNSMNYRKLIEKIEMYRKKGITKPIRTHIREAVIRPDWVGLTFEVHSGKEFKKMVIAANMLDHTLGDYAYTTKRVQHSAPGIRATRGSKFLAAK
jgi:small subunit ribosomal protein S19